MIAAIVAGQPLSVSEVDARERMLRASALDSALPRPGTSEGRQLRRWLTQVLVTEKVVAIAASSLGLGAEGAPAESELLPDLTARLEIGSIAAGVLIDPLARAVKLADIADNSHPARLAALDEASRARLVRKYEAARQALLG